MKPYLNRNKWSSWFAVTVIAVMVFLVGAVASRAADPTADGRTSAVQYDPETIANTPTSIAASTTSGTEVIVDVRRHPSVTFQLDAKLTGTNTAAASLIAAYKASVDGVTWETSARGSVAVTVDGVLNRTGVTNVTVGGVGWYKFTFQNTATNVCTNIVLQVVGKPEYVRAREY
jgi:hypothetical protein